MNLVMAVSTFYATLHTYPQVDTIKWPSIEIKKQKLIPNYPKPIAFPLPSTK